MSEKEPTEQEGSVESFYRDLWKTYKIGHDENFRRRRIERFIDSWIREKETSKNHLRLLDLGCGNGWLSHRLQRYGEVVAADIEESTLERARSVNPGIQFRKLQLEDETLGLGKSEYDIVVATEVLEHVKDKRGFVATIRTLLKPEGLMVLTTPRGEFFDRWRIWVNDNFQPVEEWIDMADLRKLISQEGFEVLRHETLYYARHDSTLFDRLFGSRLMRQLRFFPWLYELLFDQRGIYQAISATVESSNHSPAGKK